MTMSKTQAMKVGKTPEASSVRNVLDACVALREEVRTSDRRINALTSQNEALAELVDNLQETKIAQERNALQAQVAKLKASVGPLRDAMTKKKLAAVRSIDDLPEHVQKVIQSLINLPGLGQLYICKACGGIYQDGYVCSCDHDNSADQRHYKKWAEPLLTIDSFIDYDNE